MLRSFAERMNDTVFCGPENEGGGGDAGEGDLGGADAGGDIGSDADGGDGGGEGGEAERPLTVREELKRSIEEVRNQEEGKKPKRDKTTGRFGAGKDKTQEAGEGAGEQQQQAQTVAPPDSLPKEAKAEWDKTPPAIQAAFVKREQDMAAGVAELKNKYSLIDQAIAPHTDKLRQMNATPGEAVNRMFLWFGALAGNPKESFPALAKSMGIDWNRLIAPAGATQGSAEQVAAQGTGSGTAPEIPEPVKQYVGQLEQKIGQLTQFVHQLGGQIAPIQQNINTQNEARTRENLSIWSKDKPYFEDVRQTMAQFIQSGVVPLRPDGQVDLDTAYERAIYFSPEVRAKVLAAQQQANQQVQQEAEKTATTAQQTQVNKARKAAGGSLPASSTPGNGNGVTMPKKKPGEKSNVRDSLKQAIAQLRDQ